MENQSEIVSKFLKRFNIISIKTDASIYRDKRRSLSIGTANSAQGVEAVALLADRTSKEKDKSEENDKENENKAQDAQANKGKLCFAFFVCIFLCLDGF